jgi:hypothetical protein
MTITQVRKLHRAVPFRPFEIHLADSRAFAVDHPELLAVIPPGRTIVVGLEDGTAEIVDLPLVTSLTLRANGQTRKRRR